MSDEEVSCEVRPSTRRCGVSGVGIRGENGGRAHTHPRTTAHGISAVLRSASAMRERGRDVQHFCSLAHSLCHMSELRTRRGTENLYKPSETLVRTCI